TAFHMFSCHCFCAHRHLHSFPTRRSSDLRPTSSQRYSKRWEQSPDGKQGPTRRRSRRVRLPATSYFVHSWPSRPSAAPSMFEARSEEHTSELQSRENLVCRLLLEKKKKKD